MNTRTQHDLNILKAYDANRHAIDKAEHGRLERGLMLALHGAVNITPDGTSVQSQKTADKVYDVEDGDCNCLDTRAPRLNNVKRCKHQWAVWLIEDALDPALIPLLYRLGPIIRERLAT